MVRELPIRADALSAVVVGDQLREIRVGGRVALDAVYVAVRDAGWGTVPGEFLDYRTESPGAVSFVMRHVAGDIDFCWRGRIAARHNEIRFEMDGVAETDFDACRIGFCLLHPLSLSGHRVVVQTPHGPVTGEFPERISPVQVFEDVMAMSYEIVPGTGIAVRLDGDLFETEDHRNWADAGWKTYCTPLRNGFPFTVGKGQCVTQTITLIGHGAVHAPTADNGTAEVRVTTGPAGSLPKVGLGAGSPTPNSGVITALKPAHITAEIDLADDWQSRLERAAREAVALHTTLDLWLVTDDSDLGPVVDAIAASPARLGRIAIFDATTHVTVPGLATRLRELTVGRGRDVQIGGGSRAAYAELNRMALPLTELDFVTYSISPQVHHTDDESIMNTIPAQGHTLRDALRSAAGLPVVIGPITLATRFDPNRRGQLINVPDPRQWTQFTAAWAAGSIASLAGASALTYFQTAGPHGLLAPFTNDASSPVYDLFRMLARFPGAGLSRIEINRADIAALAIRHHGGHTLLVANLGSRSRSVQIREDARSTEVELCEYGTALVESF